MRMRNHIRFGLVVIALLAGVTSAQAASRHRSNQTVRVGTLRQSAHYPSPGSSVVYAGTVRSRLGRGTIRLTVVITGHPSPATFKFKGTSTAFYPRGTTRGTFTGTGTLRAGGRFALAGRGHYTGGSLYPDARRKYSFTGTAPSPPQPPPPPACAVPAGWKTVAGDAEVVVIEDQSDDPSQEYRYCDYANASRGFQLLVHNDSCGGGATVTCSQVDGVALSYILYHTSTAGDTPACGGANPTIDGSSTVYAVDTGAGSTVTLAHGSGGITAAGISPPGVGAWVLTFDGCWFGGNLQHTETLQSYSFRTGAVMTLDTGDPGESPNSPASLADLQLYQCAARCPANTAVVAWTHDGTWRYEQIS